MFDGKSPAYMVVTDRWRVGAATGTAASRVGGPSRRVTATIYFNIAALRDEFLHDWALLCWGQLMVVGV